MAIERADPPQHVAWARDRFEMGCERPAEAESLSDYLLALRALLDATSDAGEASLALRVAALCAEEGGAALVQRRIESAMALERFVMGGGPRDLAERRLARSSWSPRWRATCARCCATCCAATSTAT